MYFIINLEDVHVGEEIVRILRDRNPFVSMALLVLFGYEIGFKMYI